MPSDSEKSKSSHKLKDQKEKEQIETEKSGKNIKK
jgi:hypothetical protein